MNKALFSLLDCLGNPRLSKVVAVAALAVCASACTSLRQEVTCERAEVVARAALDALVARCPAVLGKTPPADVNAGAANKPVDLNAGAATKLDPPIPHSRT